MFNLLSNNSNDPVSFLKSDTHYNDVANKLCEKRHVLEESLSSKTQAEREEAALDLMRLKESMRIFGITEIDYQAHLEKTKK